jgi:hypothetical protein
MGLACFVLSLILFLPIPFFNAAPAIALALIALGMIQRDGVVTAIGILVGGLTIGVLFGLVAFGSALLAR